LDSFKYTPQPVVQFIVSAVDDILKRDFGISSGLFDTSKITIGDKSYHKIQILDPATGTDTSLAEVINNIYKRFENQQVLAWINRYSKT
jgi:predicted helicase